MKNLNFLLLRIECCNLSKNSPCRIVLVGIKDSIVCEEKEILVEPSKSDFDYLESGITFNDLKGKGSFDKHWVELQDIISKYPLLVATNDGYDAEVLYNSIKRFGVQCQPIPYVTSKNMMRKSIHIHSYSFDSLCEMYKLECNDNLPLTKARVWVDIILKSYDKIEEDNLESFFSENKLVVGQISSGEFKKSYLKKNSRKRIYKSNQEVDIIIDESKFQPDHLFFDQLLVFTGSFDYFVKDEARRWIEEIGGHYSDGLTKSTNFLVVGTQNPSVVGPDGLSAKQRKAIKYNQEGCDIEILTEKEFLEIMGMQTYIDNRKFVDDMLDIDKMFGFK